jgi:hypothetical protein
MPFSRIASTMVDYIKKHLFNVSTPAQDAQLGPIVPPENQIMEAMMKLPRLSINSVHPALPARRAVKRAATRSNACALPPSSNARRAQDEARGAR